MIDGTLAQPLTSTPLHPFWNRCNDMVLSWLLNSISTEIRDSVVYFSTIKEIWDDLSIRFSQSNVPRIFQLKKDLIALNQGSMSITAYFTKMRTLTDELNINSLSQFIMGLNDGFTAIRGQMLMMKPLPTLSQAYSLLLQEEGQRSTPMSSVPENIAMNVKFAGNKSNQIASVSSKKNNADELCDFCHNTGHHQDKCFFLHGYPDWHRLYGKPKPKMKVAGVKKLHKYLPNHLLLQI
ncbi:uncharacterized protein LOC141665422 [Apium graveolens]|uniref:uncharacterized protein LOC141665422 n=1 Tax=Apium graveolens TaxID=4045 RepID=UPI003D79A09B